MTSNLGPTPGDHSRIDTHRPNVSGGLPRAWWDTLPFPAGTEIDQPRTGDLGLTHGKGWVSQGIRVGQRLRAMREPALRPFCRWNHAFVFFGTDGTILEALSRGVVRSHISKYADKDYVVIRVQAVPLDTLNGTVLVDVDDNARLRAEHYLSHEEGSRYGFVTIGSIAIAILTGGSLAISLEGSNICSGLGAGAVSRFGCWWPRAVTHVMPADIGMRFGIEGPLAR